MTAQMYTPLGDAIVGMMLLNAAAMVDRGGIERTDLPRWLTDEIALIAKTHPEVRDTEPQCHIVEVVNRICTRKGWLPITREDLS